MLSTALSILVAVSAPQIPADGYITRPDVKIHYRTVGQGKPIVILSGGPGQDVKQLSGIYERLKQDRLCILFEQRATGRSTLAKLDKSTINLEAYVEDIEAFRKEMKLEKLSLLGHSWGAMLALSYAVEHPTRVDELVLVSSGPITMEHFPVMMDVMQHRMNLLQAKGPLNEPQELRELRPIFFDQEKAVAFANRDQTGEVASIVSHILIPDLQERKFDLRSGAAKLKCRTLIIQGRHDMVPESLVLQMQAGIPGAELKFIERAGHFTWIEQPEAFFQALVPFLAKDR